MDIKFNSKLQTAANLIGREGEFKAPKSQDPMDKLLHEYFIASVIGKIMDNRKEIARDIIYEEREDICNSLCSEAVRHNAKQTTSLVSTEHYAATLAANKPASRVDLTRLMVELVKLGVDQAIVQQAMDMARVSNAPAKVLTVVTTHER